MQQKEEQTLEFEYSEISRRVNSRIVTNVMEGSLSLCSEYMRSKKMSVGTEFLPDLADRQLTSLVKQIPVAVNTVLRLLMMDSKSFRNIRDFCQNKIEN
jgi:hypothetical protein